jgi:glyoxylase-like metal-dependent hydrolase (beta-lactamase superfamily II)
VSHHHVDHVGAVDGLRQATGAPVAGFCEQAGPEFAPDVRVDDGGRVAGLTALHTPGHASDHLCFALAGANGVLFSADHVMSWSTSVISPPGGDMRDYFASLEKLLGRADRLYLPGHGPPLPDPQALVRELLAHRQARERAILGVLQPGKPADTPAIAGAVYTDLDPRLRPAAERNILAHLLKLEVEGRVVREGEGWRAA